MNTFSDFDLTGQVALVTGGARGLGRATLLALAMASCGGGGGEVPPSPGTPAGTYTLTVTGALSGSALQHSITLTLKVS